MSRSFKLLIGGLFACTWLLATQAWAEAAEGLAERLVVNGKAMPVKTIKDTPVAGIFEVRLENGETFYSDANAEHFIIGEMLANQEQGLVNLTEQAHSAERAERLADIPSEQQVSFRAEQKPQAIIHVFTDVTCPYCRKLHEEVPRLNELGIEVRYLAFPRSGMQSDGARTLEQVWCADNPSEAMSAAKRGEALRNSVDCGSPVEEQYHLGLGLGVQGTPAIILPDGQMIPGYVPAERLAGMLGIDS